ncbi:methyl farnesoate epoxidase-like [Pollicipes pollicipes]|nr:methyl farnesoate epoxidase-like [Pollicipes pollicipes]
MDFTAVVAVVAFCLFLYYSTRKPPNYPPGPFRMPIVGTLWRTHLNMSIPITERHRNMIKIYGKVLGTYIMSNPSVHIADFDLAKEVFNKRESTGRPKIDIARIRTHGKLRGVLLNEGPSWLAQRRFALHHLRDLGLGRTSLEVIVQREIDTMVTRIDTLGSQPLKVNGLFNVHIVNVLWEIVTGKT